MDLKGLLVVGEGPATDARVRVRQLAAVANKPLLHYALESMAALGITHAVVAVSAHAEGEVREQIRDGERWGVRVSYCARPAPFGTLEALIAARGELGGAAVVVHDGDCLPSASVARAVARFTAERCDAVVVARASGQPAGVHVFGSGMVQAAEAVVPSPDGRRDVRDAAAWLSEHGGNVKTEFADDWWSYTGGDEQLLEGNRLALAALERDPVAARAVGCRIEGSVQIHESAVVESATIRGPVVIGARAEISQAYIGPYTSIGDDVHVRGAELENSVVLREARVEYVGTRIEASVIGARARVSSDFSLPKAMRVRIGDDSVVHVA